MFNINCKAYFKIRKQQDIHSLTFCQVSSALSSFSLPALRELKKAEGKRLTMESDYRHWGMDMIFFPKFYKERGIGTTIKHPVSICRLNDWENKVPLLLKNIKEAQNDDKSWLFTQRINQFNGRKHYIKLELWHWWGLLDKNQSNARIKCLMVQVGGKRYVYIFCFTLKYSHLHVNTTCRHPCNILVILIFWIKLLSNVISK